MHGAGTSAQSARAQGVEHTHYETGDPRGKAGALVKAVREVTEKYKDVAVAGGRQVHARVRLRQRSGMGGHGSALRELALVVWTASSTSRSRKSSIYEPLPNGR